MLSDLKFIVYSYLPLYDLVQWRIKDHIIDKIINLRYPELKKEGLMYYVKTGNLDAIKDMHHVIDFKNYINDEEKIYICAPHNILIYLWKANYFRPSFTLILEMQELIETLPKDIDVYDE